MSAAEFRASAESGEIPIKDHDQLLRLAYVYIHGEVGGGDGVFDTVDKFHTRGWTFGHGDLAFHR
jgi:hypothetical protein